MTPGWTSDRREDKLKQKEDKKIRFQVNQRFFITPQISPLPNPIQIKVKKIPHRNRSQVQVSLKVTAQNHHLNITVMLDFF